MPKGIYYKTSLHRAKLSQSVRAHCSKPTSKVGKYPRNSNMLTGKYIRTPLMKTGKYKKSEEHRQKIKLSLKKIFGTVGIISNKHAGCEYENWRISVFKRDNFVCQICLKVGGGLHAHHIKEWSKFKELRFNIDNGITVCETCHMKLHGKKKGKKK